MRFHQVHCACQRHEFGLDNNGVHLCPSRVGGGVSRRRCSCLRRTWKVPLDSESAFQTNALFRILVAPLTQLLEGPFWSDKNVRHFEIQKKGK